MAAIAPGLNFRIGADVKGVNKAIREAEKSLRGAVQSFSSIGNSLSVALSAPLAAFGVMSVKAAGEMESLRFALEGTMKDAGRSINEAGLELEALRKAALAPGLDFEQAVKGSVRLQSVGIQAEEARRIIVELANALALSGGTADQLDGVTRQFSQMIGKGKILQEDISIILENMPALAGVMKKEFGQTTAEGLNKAGVSVTDFITRLTDGMSKLQRAQGGISNSITNAMSAIRQALATVGEEINKTFNVSGALNSFSEWVSGLATWFKNLDGDTKRLIGAFVVFAATIGPAFKLMQAGIWIAGQLQIAFILMQRTLAQSLAGQAIPSVITAWKAMDFAMRASIIGGIAAVVLAAAAAFVVLRKDMSAAAVAARQVDDVTRSAQESIVGETTKTGELVRVIQDSKRSYDDKKAALLELQKISPQYFGALDTENIKVTEVEAANNRYTDSLLRAATARAALAQIEENAKARINMKDNIDPSWWQTTVNYVKSLGNANIFLANQVKSGVQNMNEQRAALDASDEAMRKLIEANSTVGETSEKTTTTQKAEKKGVDDLAKSYRDLDKSQRLLNRGEQTKDLKAFKGTVSPEIDASTTLPDTLNSIEDPFKNIANSIRVATAAMSEHLTMAGQAAAMYKIVREGTDGLSASMQSMANTMIQNGDIIGAIMLSVGDAVAQAGAQGASSLKDFAKAALGAAAKVIKAWIQMAVTRAALSAMESIPFPFNIAAAAAAGGLAAGLFSSLVKKVGIPALAEGGVLTGPQLVMAGEYPGARTNPEIVTPENKMRDIFSEVLGGGGGMGGGQLTCRVDGDSLLFVLEKAKMRNVRKR